MKRIALVFVLLAACKSSDGSAPEAPAPTPTAAPPARNANLPKLRPTPTEAGEGSEIASGTSPGGSAVDRMSPEARAARHKEKMEALASRLDTDGDGKVSVKELTDGPIKFDDPAAIDTNHDGVISEQELQVGLQAHRLGGQRHHKAQPAPADPAPAP